MSDIIPMTKLVKFSGDEIRVWNEKFCNKGDIAVKIDCPNCSEHSRTIFDRSGANPKKCTGCGYNDCDIIISVAFDGEKWELIDLE